MVIVTDWLPLSVAPPPETVPIAMIAVSSVLVSYMLSSVGVNVVVPVVEPAEIVISDIVP